MKNVIHWMAIAGLGAGAWLASGCSAGMIGSSEVEATDENLEVYEVIEEYQRALEERDVEALETRRRILGDEHPATNTSLKAMIEFQNQWHEIEPDAGHDATAAEYQAQLDAIEAEKANEPAPAAP